MLRMTDYIPVALTPMVACWPLVDMRTLGSESANVPSPVAMTCFALWYRHGWLGRVWFRRFADRPGRRSSLCKTRMLHGSKWSVAECLTEMRWSLRLPIRGLATSAM